MKVSMGKYPKGADKERKISVKIDNFDIWSLDHTLALIILPCLIKLKEIGHSSPNVSDEDVPDRLKSTSATPLENDWDVDEFHHDRWQWVLDEMIFAFQAIIADDSIDLFSSGEHDITWKKVSKSSIPVDGLTEDYYYEMTKGPNDTYVLDKEGYEAYEARINNGTRLFGVYYRGLWD